MGVWWVSTGVSCRVAAAVVAVAGGATEFVVVVVEQLVPGMVLRLDDGRH